MFIVQTYSKEQHKWRNRNVMVAEEPARAAYKRARAQAESGGHYPVRLLHADLDALAPAVHTLAQEPGIGRLLAAA